MTNRIFQTNLYRFRLLILGLILVLAAYLRLVNAGDNSGWYTDEGTHLDIAQHYLQGQVQYLAVNQSTLLFGKLPLFELLLAGLLGVFDGGMGTLRILTGSLGVISIALLYWVVRRTQPNDVILSSPGIAWLLKANAADFQMSAAVKGQKTVHLPANLPLERFAFDPYYENARFIVVDNLWHNWAIWHITGVPEMMAQLESWPIVFASGDIQVYCNPVFKGCIS